MGKLGSVIQLNNIYKWHLGSQFLNLLAHRALAAAAQSPPRTGHAGVPELCVCSPSLVVPDQQGCAESAYSTALLTPLPSTHSRTRPWSAQNVLCWAVSLGAVGCCFHRKLAVFSSLLPIRPLIFLLGSLTDSVAINDYISVYSLTTVCCQ